MERHSADFQGDRVAWSARTVAVNSTLFKPVTFHTLARGRRQGTLPSKNSGVLRS
jgi:hypothetical protein